MKTRGNGRGHVVHHVFYGDKVNSPQEIDTYDHKQWSDAGSCHWFSSGKQSAVRRFLLWISVFE